jgi:hypothetical protein
MRSKVLAGAGIAALVAGVISAVLLTGPATASTASNAASAVGYANQHGYKSAIGVLDTQSGSFSGAGDYNSTYASESVMKVFIATRLLMTGQMSGWNATTAYKMITQSDDASANALYGRTGGDGVITWVKQALNLPNLGSPPLRPGWWGGTQITAAGMAQFYNAVRHRPDVWGWLGNAMHHATSYGSDGTYQFFGIPSATTGAAIKQGWGGDNAAGQPAFNSTGLVNSDRYAVVILTQGGVYGTPISNMLTSEAKLLMPNGRIASDSPFGGMSGWSLHGRYLTVSGWALDPNALSTPLRIFFYVNGKPFSYLDSNVARSDINRAYGATGNHGFSKTLTLPDGSSNVCAYAINVGAGTTNTQLGCHGVMLGGSPLGGLSKLSQTSNIATLTGWGFDYDAPDTALRVQASINGLPAGSTVSNISRPDINAAFHGTGLHGFSLSIRVPAGTTTICIQVANVGRGAATRIGCANFRVSASPIGIFNAVTMSGQTATVKGWTFDYSNPAAAIQILVSLNGKYVAYRATSVNRPDINSAYQVTGVHGYQIALALPAGPNKICVQAINIGAGSNSTLGCQTITPVTPTSAGPVPPGTSPSVQPSVQPSGRPSSQPSNRAGQPSSSPSGSAPGAVGSPTPTGSASPSGS